MLSTTDIYGSSSYETKKLSVPIYKQEKSNWCWVASARMMAKYHVPSSTRTQTQMVVYIKGSNVNKTGTTTEAANAAKYAAHNQRIYLPRSAQTFDVIKARINENVPVYAAAGYYDSNNERHGGHAVVIYGYQIVPKSTGGIYYNDPSTASSHYTRFSSFCDGSYNGRKYDGSVY